MVKIEILGIGCPRCEKTESVIRKAVENLGWKEEEDYKTFKIKDPAVIASRGVLMTPGVAADGKVVSSGKIPAESTVLSWPN